MKQILFVLMSNFQEPFLERNPRERTTFLCKKVSQKQILKIKNNFQK